jgi:hypothetical protein
MCLIENYSEVHIGKNLSDVFPIDVKQGDDLSTLLLNYALEYAIRTVEENQDGLQANGMHQLLFYDDGFDIEGENINITKKNTKTLLEASREVDLKVNPKKTWYMVMFRHQNVVQNHNLLVANKSFENVTTFRYLGQQ